MDKYYKNIGLLLILLIVVGFFYTLPANAQWWFDNLENKTGTQAAKISRQNGWRFVFNPREAKTPHDLDLLSNIRVDRQRRVIFADCTSYYRVKDYSNQRVKNRATVSDAMKDFDGSPIKAEFKYRVTTDPFMNGIIVHQSIRPGEVIKSDVYNNKAAPEKKTYFKKPVLNKGYSYSPKNYFSPSKNQEKIIRFDAFRMNSVVMPDLTHMTYEDALAKIKREHVPVFYIQATEEETKDFKKNNIVFLQSTKPGIVVSKNIMLGLKVYKFKGTTQVPDVLNKALPAAVDFIKKANLIPELKYIGLAERYPLGIPYNIKKSTLNKVLKQNPGKGNKVSSGTKVTITILKLPKTRMPDITRVDVSTGLKKLSKILYPAIKKYGVTRVNIFAKTGEDNIIQSTRPGPGQIVTAYDLITVNILRTIPLIPDVIGMTEARATAELKKYGLEVKYKGSFPNPKFKTGQVYSIYPGVGNVIKPDTNISLTIADNESMVLPFVVNRTPEQAVKNLKESGYNNYVFEYKYVDKNNEHSFLSHKDFINKVWSVTPDKQKQIVPQDTQIHLEIVKWAEDKLVEVPYLSGLTEAGAIAYLKNKGLIPDITYRTTNLAEYAGKVLGGQMPKAYTRVKKGSIVNFTVVAYKVTMPAIVHLTEQDAVAELAKIGLKAKIIYESADSLLFAGKVKEQKPKFREKIDSGSTVELIVYQSSGLVTIPNLINHELNKAIINVLTDKKLKFKVSQKETVLNTIAGKIFKTIPAYQQKVKQGSTITLFIYKKLKNIPDVTGKNEIEATRILEGLGFAVKKYYIKDVKAGIVSIQSQKAGSPPLHAAISLGIGKINIPAPMMNIRVSQASSNDVIKIKEFYNQFKDAYESKDEYQVVSLISGNWDSSDGNSIADLEDNLHNIFNVFDEIQYNISNITIQPDQDNMYRVSYNVAIRGIIYEADITHNEKSSVQELVKLADGKVRIIKTLNGNFWSMK